MDQQRYTLEWRGARKGPWTLTEIEQRLDEGEIHSLMKIHVDGRWLALRDFLEDQRLQSRKREIEEQAYANARAAYIPPPVQPATRESHVPEYVRQPSQQAQQPAPQTWPSGQEGGTIPSSDYYRSLVGKPGQPRSHTPLYILGGVIITIIALAASYLFITLSRRDNKPDVAAVVTSNPGITVETTIDAKSGSSADPAPSTAPEVAATPGSETKPSTKDKDKDKDKDVAKTEPVNGKPQQPKFMPYSFTGKEFYPSALISLATVDWNGDEQLAEDKKTEDDAQLRKQDTPVYGDENSWLGVEVGGLKKGAQVAVEVTADGFMKTSKWQGSIPVIDIQGYALILPKIMWNFEALMKVNQQRPVNVIFSVSVDGVALPDLMQTYTLRSINDCPLSVQKHKKDRKPIDLSFLFAAYVNENHPQVNDILQEALACQIINHFNGYQSEDPKQVYMQVLSIWNALQRRSIKYSSIADTLPGDLVFSQSVRFMDQSIKSRQANCVDGSVLMASVLQKIGIKAYLVLIPGHCFLAFDLEPNSTSLPVGLETTKLGDNSITDIKNVAFLQQKDLAKEYQDSFKTFCKAVDSGNAKIKSFSRMLQGNKDPRFRLVSIEEARGDGIMPIPYVMENK